MLEDQHTSTDHLAPQWEVAGECDMGWHSWKHLQRIDVNFILLGQALPFL